MIYNTRTQSSYKAESQKEKKKKDLFNAHAGGK